MARYRVIYRTEYRIPGQDARAVALELWRDDEYLGAVEGIVSGLDLVQWGPATTGVDVDRFWHAVAIGAGRLVQADLQAGKGPTAWRIEAHLVHPSVAEADALARSDVELSEQVRAGDVVIEFD